VKPLAAVLALLVLASVARAGSRQPAALASAVRALQDGVSHVSVTEIMGARADIGALRADDDSPLVEYWLALASWRAEPLLLPTDREGARRLLKDGIDACDRAFAADPRFGEALAVKASLQALSLTFVPGAAPSLAPEMEESFARAHQLEPRNARVLLLNGIYLLHKPAQYGGGAERARALFERASALLATRAADPRGIEWGRDDVPLWYGRCLAALGDWAGARERYREALAVNPDHRWLKDNLLPEAERHLAAPADSR